MEGILVQLNDSPLWTVVCVLDGRFTYPLSSSLQNENPLHHGKVIHFFKLIHSWLSSAGTEWLIFFIGIQGIFVPRNFLKSPSLHLY